VYFLENSDFNIVLTKLGSCAKLKLQSWSWEVAKLKLQSWSCKVEVAKLKLGSCKVEVGKLQSWSCKVAKLRKNWSVFFRKWWFQYSFNQVEVGKLKLESWS
jgi:hypothetical protein